MQAKRFGVIGVGGWGRTHVKTYREHLCAHLSCVCDKEPETLREVGDRYEVDGLYTDFRAMLGEENLDAVSIVTPDFAHTEVVLAAIQAGVDVLVEKPLATSLEECDRIGQALCGTDVRLMVDFHNRWNPSMARFKKSIDGGEIGEVQMAYYRLNDNISVPTQMLSWAGRSTVLWFLASHCLDTMRWLFDDEVEEVYTVCRSRVLQKEGIDTPDYYQSTLQFQSGATAVLENCWTLPESHPLIDVKMEVVGDTGALYFDGRPHRVEQFQHENVNWPDVYVCPEVFGESTGFAPESIRDFVGCVVKDRDVKCGWEEGRAVTQAILAMEKSAQTGEPVSVNSP